MLTLMGNPHNTEGVEPPDFITVCIIVGAILLSIVLFTKG